MTQDKALSIWEYVGGELFWLQSRGRVNAGDLAGYLLHQKTDTTRIKSYYVVTYNYKAYLLHRIIYLMHHGYFPEQIDHIDGNSLNNEIENLRECEVHQNCSNRGMQSNNKSGYKGVYWSKQSQKWGAQITKHRKKYHLGLYHSAADAHAIYQKAAVILHEEFANFG